jgi:hypothetical protein
MASDRVDSMLVMELNSALFHCFVKFIAGMAHAESGPRVMSGAGLAGSRMEWIFFVWGIP